MITFGEKYSTFITLLTAANSEDETLFNTVIDLVKDDQEYYDSILGDALMVILGLMDSKAEQEGAETSELIQSLSLMPCKVDY